MWLNALAIALVASVSFTRAEATSARLRLSQDQAPASPLNPAWAVVLTDEQAKPFWRPRLCSRMGPGAIDSTWTPDASTIGRLEAALARTLQAALDEAARQAGRKSAAADYYRQYAGYVVKGKRFVYVNGFLGSTVKSPAPAESWRTRASLACDGGTLFFGAEFDVQRGQIGNLVFNGPP
jgi:hypothetical protein